MYDDCSLIWKFSFNILQKFKPKSLPYLNYILQAIPLHIKESSSSGNRAQIHGNEI